MEALLLEGDVRISEMRCGESNFNGIRRIPARVAEHEPAGMVSEA